VTILAQHFDTGTQSRK